MDINELKDTIIKDLTNLIEKEQKINEIYSHNLSRAHELWKAAQAYSLEKSKDDISLRLAIQLAFQVGAKWADEHPRKHYRHETKDL